MCPSAGERRGQRRVPPPGRAGASPQQAGWGRGSGAGSAAPANRCSALRRRWGRRGRGGKVGKIQTFIENIPQRDAHRQQHNSILMELSISVPNLIELCPVT